MTHIRIARLDAPGRTVITHEDLGDTMPGALTSRWTVDGVTHLVQVPADQSARVRHAEDMAFLTKCGLDNCDWKVMP
jgi:hypothetical protein